MKRRKVKETLGILLALTFAVSTLAGCGSGKEAGSIISSIFSVIQL